MTRLEVKFILNISGIIEDIRVHRNVGTAILQETLDLQPEGLKGRLTNISEENGCDEKDEDALEDIMQQITSH